MKRPGPNRRRQTRNFAEEIKAMAAVVKDEVYVVKKTRGKDRGPRNLVERKLRADVIKWLKKHGWRVWRIENSIGGRSSGIADLLVAKHKMIFVELKGTGGLTGKQPEFKEWCNRCGMAYMIVRNVGELDKLNDI